MCHAWNKIMEDTEDHLKELLAQYITDKEGLIDFSIVRSKLTSASEGELSDLASHILKAYFWSAWKINLYYEIFYSLSRKSQTNPSYFVCSEGWRKHLSSQFWVPLKRFLYVWWLMRLSLRRCTLFGIVAQIEFWYFRSYLLPCDHLPSQEWW